MAERALAREEFLSLQASIARIEGRAGPRFTPGSWPLPEKVSDSANLPATASGTRPSAVSVRREDRGEVAGSPASVPPAVLPLGLEDLDAVLEGGIPLQAVSEFRSETLRDGAAATGFVLALAARLARQEALGGSHHAGRETARVLWIGDPLCSREAGLPHAAGLADFGLQPESLVYARPKKLDEALWLAEAGLKARSFCAVILEISGNPARFGLTETRRLSLRAKACARPLFLLRQAGIGEAASASFRFCLSPAPSRATATDGSRIAGLTGLPAFRLVLEKSRLPAFPPTTLEWNADECQFSRPPVATRSAGRAPAADPRARLSLPAHRPDRPQALGAVVAFERAS